MTDLDSIRSRWHNIAREDAELAIGGVEWNGYEPGLQLWTRSGAHRDLEELESDAILENVCADVAHLLALIDRHGITDTTPPPIRLSVLDAVETIGRLQDADDEHVTVDRSRPTR